MQNALGQFHAVVKIMSTMSYANTRQSVVKKIPSGWWDRSPSIFDHIPMFNKINANFDFKQNEPNESIGELTAKHTNQIKCFLARVSAPSTETFAAFTRENLNLGGAAGPPCRLFRALYARGRRSAASLPMS
jgi:hypothetical protein